MLCLPRNLHLEVHIALCLPRNLHMEVHKVLRLPRNLHIEIHKVLHMPRILHMEAHKVLRLPQNLRMEVHELLCLPRNLHMEVHKVLRLPRNLRMAVHKVLCRPRNLHMEVHKVPRLLRNHTKSACGGSQSAAPATKSALQETSENSNHNGGTIPPKAWRFAKCCACHEICARNLRIEVHKVLRLPRNLHVEGSQSAVPATKSAVKTLIAMEGRLRP